MRFQVVIDEDAEREFAGAVDFYNEREPGLGRKFARDVRDVFEQISENLERFPRHSRLARRAKGLDWFYAVYFALKAETSELVIIAVWHGARNPAELRRRLKQAGIPVHTFSTSDLPSSPAGLNSKIKIKMANAIPSR
jgi:plasmid stabilization system protein ParE